MRLPQITPRHVQAPGAARRAWSQLLPTVLCALLLSRAAAAADGTPVRDWLARWETSILAGSRSRYCDREMGEDLGWTMSPFLTGFYNGYLATQDPKWIDLLIDWTDAWVRRGVKEPDGFTGWPKANGASTSVVPDLYTDNMLGEAMVLRPVVRMSGEILKDPALKAKYGAKATGYIKLAETVFRKWDARGCWRKVNGGGVWVAPLFGMDPSTGKWTDGYARRKAEGFTLPQNKQNLIAEWLVAMSDVTGNRIYRDRAAQWWQVMKGRMRLTGDGKYYVWDYWDPAGPWDYKPDGSPKHWIGIHTNGAYYGIDVESIVVAYEHRLVFTKAEIDRLIATNRDFMWNKQIEGARFERLDGGPPDPQAKNPPGVLWTALVPYDETLRRVFEASHDPGGWDGIGTTPWYLALRARSAGN